MSDSIPSTGRVSRWRKKPVVIEAMRVPPKWDGKDVPYALGVLTAWLGAGGSWEMGDDGGIDIKTLEGVMHANPGDWVIRGVKGELYPCKPDIFEATYEPA